MWQSKSDEKVKFFFARLADLKKRHGFKVIDSHVHPLDVTGVAPGCSHSDTSESSRVRINKISLAENLKFGSFYYWSLEKLMKRAPNIVAREIKSYYADFNNAKLLHEMKANLIDGATLVPVEPWAKTADVKSCFSDKRYLHLGSFDIHNQSIESIGESFKIYQQKIGIVGIKLHPNLQNFHPLPEKNSKEVEAKLNLIYDLAEKNKLYILVHGGKSILINKVNSEFEREKRASDSALLENFTDMKGRSTFLCRKIKIIIAHLGSYHVGKPNVAAAMGIVRKYPNVYFDTSCSSTDNISRFIEEIGSEKLVYGSDAPYDNFFDSTRRVFEAANRAKTKENFDEILINIYGKNYSSIIDLPLTAN